MQLEKLVTYHKALSDPTRIRILCLLAAGEFSGLALAEKLGVSPPTITHHAAKLREASLIYERRDRNTVYFSLNGSFLALGADETVKFICRNSNKPILSEEEEEEAMRGTEVKEKWKSAVLRNFFTPDGRLKHIPVQLKKKLVILEALAERLELGRSYPEAEINTFMKTYYADYATLRREMIMHQFMYREKEIYELNPREIWAKWDELH
ncbi:MAG: metalloregulator ArsR/SmtB family transcription factor [Gorillibacterium sp.]|nr:metalloregulator ArsR/SmtB family transcription factor [Gorillibacterium sp.]